jgi:hypothetical protein
MAEATQLEIDMAALAHSEARDLIRRLTAEGLPAAAVVTGVSAALYELLTAAHGPSGPLLWHFRATRTIRKVMEG